MKNKMAIRERWKRASATAFVFRPTGKIYIALVYPEGKMEQVKQFSNLAEAAKLELALAKELDFE